jgi:ribonuclease BN (tRNA processing enzyme)
VYGSPQEQANVSAVVLTHSHADHVCSLPTFAMNVMDLSGRRTIVWSHEAVLQSLREDVFNGRVWPDFLTLIPEGEPIVSLRQIAAREPFSIDGLRFTAIPVNHPVPTMGYIVEDAESAVIICTDSGPTVELWDRARTLPNLRAVFVGVAFPDECQLLAEASGHLTPRLLREQIEGIQADVRIIVVHIKPARRPEVIAQLFAIGMNGVEIGSSRAEYDTARREAVRYVPA